ncbi:MAG: RNA polymerase sigma factor [Deltaproteobacteria bacterium]|nr:RNA polymerase sigma factor [Deltaproteobacteria bacterium]
MDGKMRERESSSQSGPSGQSGVSDEELMVLYQRGDEASFGVLYARHSGRVYGFLMNSLRDKPMADDVFQATFMKLHRARSSYDPCFPFVPWLFTVCRGVMIDSIRKAGRIHEDLDLEAVERAQARGQDQEQDALPELPNLASLPAAQRKAVELRYGQELSFDEIAGRLDTSPLNVRQLVSRAIKKLRLAK